MASEVDTIETTTSLDDEVKHWEHKEAFAMRQHTRVLELQAQHVLDILNHMKEEGLSSKDIEVATQNMNNACHTLNSQKRVRAAGLIGHMLPSS